MLCSLLILSLAASKNKILLCQSEYLELTKALTSELNKFKYEPCRTNKKMMLEQIHHCRFVMKNNDLWYRYLEPIAYKKINAPLPIEWETEVFEKWEKPYKRVGAGFTLAELYLEEENFDPDVFLGLISESLDAVEVYESDSVVQLLQQPQNFYFANRLHLLNLAAIYTTGFECPDTSQILPEIYQMMQGTIGIYKSYNASYEDYPVSSEYLLLYEYASLHVANSRGNYRSFDHFTFIKNFINPLFRVNQEQITKYKFSSTSNNDYSLSNEAISIFDKQLYKGQEKRGVFKGLSDSSDLNRLILLGKQLFNDPILSVNNKRSCASCHKPSTCFSDQGKIASLRLDVESMLDRNTPSLVNVLHNHLLTLDGRHVDPLDQISEVVQNPLEMGLSEKQLYKKVTAIKFYKTELNELASKTFYKDVTVKHIYSALVAYYGSFDDSYSLFDNAMNKDTEIANDVKQGFNLFMSKAECGTCHFVPHFNGVKPPYINSEFEVIGVPMDSVYTELSEDKGRGKVHQVAEMINAFRTPTLRNCSCTDPYMHNGVFATLEEVLDFYNKGGGVGNGLRVPNQTLNSGELNLSEEEVTKVIAFVKSLDEEKVSNSEGVILPKANRKLSNRKTEY